MLSTLPSFPDLTAVAGAVRPATVARSGGGAAAGAGEAFAAALDTAGDPAGSVGADGATAALAPQPGAETPGTDFSAGPALWAAMWSTPGPAVPAADAPVDDALDGEGAAAPMLALGDLVAPATADEAGDTYDTDEEAVAVPVPDAARADVAPVVEVIAPVAVVLPAPVTVETAPADAAPSVGVTPASAPASTLDTTPAPSAAPTESTTEATTAATTAAATGATNTSVSTPPPGSTETFEDVVAVSRETPSSASSTIDADAATGRSEAPASHGPDVTATYGRPRATAPVAAPPSTPSAPVTPAAPATGATAPVLKPRVSGVHGAVAPAGLEVLAPKLAAPRAAAIVVPAAPLPHAPSLAVPMASAVETVRLDAATGAAIGTEIVQSIRLQTLAAGGAATISLNPTVLGKVDIAVRVEQGSVTATVHASTPAVREWVTAHRDELSQTLAQQGLRLERLDVAAPKEDAGRDAHRDGRAPERETPRQRRESRDDGEGFEAPFAEARNSAGAA